MNNIILSYEVKCEDTFKYVNRAFSEVEYDLVCDYKKGKEFWDSEFIGNSIKIYRNSKCIFHGKNIEDITINGKKEPLFNCDPSSCILKDVRRY